MNVPNGALFRDDVGSPLPGLSGSILPTQQTTQFPRFFTEVERLPKPRADGSEYAEIEYVEILQAGDTKAAPIRRVSDLWLQANPHFRPAYDAWKSGQRIAASGTPLEDWSGMGRAQVAQAKAINIFTVEQLADLNDHGLQALGIGARELQAKAKLYLERRQDEAAAERAVAENVRLQSMLAERDRSIAALTARLDALEAEQSEDAPRRGPGRPPKNVAA